MPKESRTKTNKSDMLLLLREGESLKLASLANNWVTNRFGDATGRGDRFTVELCPNGFVKKDKKAIVIRDADNRIVSLSEISSKNVKEFDRIYQKTQSSASTPGLKLVAPDLEAARIRRILR